MLFARVGAGATNGSVVVTTRLGTATSSTPCGRLPVPVDGALRRLKPTIDSVTPQRAKAREEAHAERDRVRRHHLGEGRQREPRAYAIPSDNLMYVMVPADAKAGLPRSWSRTTRARRRSCSRRSGKRPRSIAAKPASLARVREAGFALGAVLRSTSAVAGGSDSHFVLARGEAREPDEAFYLCDSRCPRRRLSSPWRLLAAARRRVRAGGGQAYGRRPGHGEAARSPSSP